MIPHYCPQIQCFLGTLRSRLGPQACAPSQARGRICRPRWKGAPSCTQQKQGPGDCGRVGRTGGGVRSTGRSCLSKPRASVGSAGGQQPPFPLPSLKRECIRSQWFLREGGADLLGAPHSADSLPAPQAVPGPHPGAHACPESGPRHSETVPVPV